MKKRKLNVPISMHKRFFGSIGKINESGYDYKEVDKKLIEIEINRKAKCKRTFWNLSRFKLLLVISIVIILTALSPHYTTF